MRYLTTTEAAAYLNNRGGFTRIMRAATVLQWCNRGKFPNAIPPANRRGEWKIPESDLATFQQPKNGRRKRE